MDVERIELRTCSVVSDPEPLDRRDIDVAIGGYKLDEDTLVVGFTFFARYGKITHMELTGNLYLKGKDFDTIVKKGMSQQLKEEISSLVAYHCMGSSTLVASAFNLPAPIVVPKVKV